MTCYYIRDGLIWRTTNPKSVPPDATILTELEHEVAILMANNGEKKLAEAISKVRGLISLEKYGNHD